MQLLLKGPFGQKGRLTDPQMPEESLRFQLTGYSEWQTMTIRATSRSHGSFPKNDSNEISVSWPDPLGTGTGHRLSRIKQKAKPFRSCTLGRSLGFSPPAFSCPPLTA